MLVRHRRSIRRISHLKLVLIIAPIIITAAIVLVNIKPAPVVTVAKITTIISEQKTKAYLPTRLKIPVINVDAAIDYTGLTPDGAMDVKQDPNKTAWYSLGPRPGENGNAVIAGHYGWFDGQPSVFNELHTLKQGDKISIIDEKNATITFTVRESQKYNPNADASNIFTSNDGISHLNLITCDGVWDNNKETYSDRLVIFADIEIK